MSKLQVLVTTMHRNNLELYDEMQLQTDVVIANQADNNSYSMSMFGDSRVEMITTNSRGTSRNRNIALAHSRADAEFVMFSDDDLKFVKQYEKLICDEFARHPEAAAIKFYTKRRSGDTIATLPPKKFQKAGIRRIASLGVWGLVIKNKVLESKNIHFNESFGPGTNNYCGEDTIFFQDLLRKNVQIYLSPIHIADIVESESTWFEGRTDNYYRTAGKILAALFPRLSYLLAIRSAYRYFCRKQSGHSFGEILKLYWNGINSYKQEN